MAARAAVRAELIQPFHALERPAQMSTYPHPERFKKILYPLTVFFLKNIFEYMDVQYKQGFSAIQQQARDHLLQAADSIAIAVLFPPTELAIFGQDKPKPLPELDLQDASRLLPRTTYKRAHRQELAEAREQVITSLLMTRVEEKWGPVDSFENGSTQARLAENLKKLIAIKEQILKAQEIVDFQRAQNDLVQIVNHISMDGAQYSEWEGPLLPEQRGCL